VEDSWASFFKKTKSARLELGCFWEAAVKSKNFEAEEKA